MESNLTIERRQEIFLALVKAQDSKVPVRESRTNAAKAFGLDVEEVKKIEKEGLEKEWPPLS
ncbi:MAG: hypothetical protein K8T89_25475 [Planctomycetes bacterium]|nr:hypothetical protein [Planctomycetota bacterium]